MLFHDVQPDELTQELDERDKSAKFYEVSRKLERKFKGTASDLFGAFHSADQTHLDLSLAQLEVFCNHAPSGNKLRDDFDRRRNASKNPQKYEMCDYVREILAEAA